MKLRYRLFQRSSGIYFIEDQITGKQQSLKTRDRHAAKRIFNARNEAHEQPAINLQIARAYLMASDPMVVKRTWQDAMEEIVRTKQGPTQYRWQTAVKDKALDLIHGVTLIETQAEHLLRVLEKRHRLNERAFAEVARLLSGHELAALGVIPKRRWPPVRFKEKRAITLAEHEKILGGSGIQNGAPTTRCFGMSGGRSPMSRGSVRRMSIERTEC